MNNNKMATKLKMLNIETENDLHLNESRLSSMKKSNYFDTMAFSFFQEVSVIGFKYCFDKSRPKLRQYFWGFLVLVGVAIAVYQITDRILLYTSYTTSTNINMVNAETLEFPQVTICNENAARMSVARKFGLVPLLTALYPPLAKASVTENIKLDPSTLPDFNRSQWEEVRQLLAQPITEAYYSCNWGASVCALSKFKTIETNMGRCFAIKASDFNLTVTRAGSFYGLTLALFVNQWDYLGTSSPSAGFRLLLHDTNEFPRMQEAAIKLSPGFITSVSVTFNAISRQPPPYGTCRDTLGYYQADCITMCESMFVFRMCKCRLHYAQGMEEIPLCTLYDMYKCAFPAQYKYTTESGANSCDCPPQCQSNTYQLSISQNIFSNRFAALASNFSEVFDLKLPVTITKDILMENYVAVQVYYSTMQYLSIVTKPAYSFMGLLSDVGGALGLLLGATLYTFVEIFEFFYDALKFWIVTKFADLHIKSNRRFLRSSKITPVF